MGSTVLYCDDSCNSTTLRHNHDRAGLKAVQPFFLNFKIEAIARKCIVVSSEIGDLSVDKEPWIRSHRLHGIHMTLQTPRAVTIISQRGVDSSPLKLPTSSRQFGKL